MYKRPIIRDMCAANMILKFHLRHLWRSVQHRSNTAHRTTLQHNIHRVIQIRQRKYTWCIIVTRIFPQPRWIQRIAVKITRIAYHRTRNMLDTRIAYLTQPTVHKRVTTYIPRTKRRVTASLNIQIPMQRTVLNIP